MPVVFGPSEIGAHATFAEKRTVSYVFRTDPAALEALIPYHFTLAEPARVMIASGMFIGVDWLAGRNYHNLRISAMVNARDGADIVTGPFHLVDWETDSHPVISGREYLGLAKLVGDIPEHERGPASVAFECYEYGTRLLRVEVTDLAPASDDVFAAANDGKDTIVLGWKFISGPGGSVDADYPVKMVSRGTIESMWVGVGCLAFDRPTWEQCPFSSRIVERLATLPVLESYPATFTISKGSVLDRGASARLDT
jgi:hypothetical protein